MTVVRVTLAPNGGIATQAIAYFFSLLGGFQFKLVSVSVLSGNTIVDIDPNGEDLVDVQSNVTTISNSMNAIATITQTTATV